MQRYQLASKTLLLMQLGGLSRDYIVETRVPARGLQFCPRTAGFLSQLI